MRNRHLFPRLFLLLYLTFGYVEAFAQSQLTNLPTIWITTQNNAAITSKERWTPGQLTTFSNEMNGKYSGEIEIRGRGNSTFRMPKRPYRIRLKEKFNLLGLPAQERNWVLLANYADKSLLRNTAAMEISQFLGMPFSCHYKLVDVYLNGIYEGNYLLTDHVQVADTRIQTDELENEDTSLPKISGGYLLEIDGTANFEPVHFVTHKTGTPVTIKYPDEDDINNEQKNYISQFFNDFEQVLFSENFKDPVNGFWKHVDKNSLVNWYIACELTGNSDSFWSTYLVKKRNDNKIYFGPLWDFDIAFDNDNRLRNAPYRHMTDLGFGFKSWILQILKDDQFKKAVHTRWNELKNRGFQAHMLQKMGQLRGDINASQVKNFEKWNILGSIVYLEPQARNTYDNEFNHLRNYIDKRFDWFNYYVNGLEPNATYKIVNRYSGKALSINDRNQVNQVNFTDKASQKWQIHWNESIAAFQLINTANGNALQGNYQSPSQLMVYPSDQSHPGQNWNITQSDENNIFTIVSRLGYAVDNQAHNFEGSPVNHSNRSPGHGPQEWVITKVEETTPDNCQFQVNAVAQKTNASCHEAVLLSAECSGPDCENISYQWSGNGLLSSTQTALVTNSQNGTYTYTLTANKNGCSSIVKTISINVTGCQEQPGNDTYRKCIEAELSEGTGPVTSDPNASGGQTRGLNNAPDFYVDYKISGVPQAGSYQLTLDYAAEASPAIQVFINGNLASSMNLSPTNSWNIVFQKATFRVNLQSGDNTIRIRSVGQSSIRQDKICVEGNVTIEVPEEPEEPEEPQPACNYTITASPDKPQAGCNESVRLIANCSGPDCNNVSYRWSGHDLNTTGSTANVAKSQNGTYTYTLTTTKDGCNTQTKSVTVQVAGCATGGQPVTFNQCIEAENSEGSGPVSGDPNASGGLTRGSESQPEHYVDYKINNVPGDGDFKLKLRYTSTGESQVNVHVNGGAQQTVSLTPSHSWNIVFNEATININLKAGSNTVRISGANRHSVRQDRICIEGTVNGDNPAPPACNFSITANASKTTASCNESIQLTTSCQGNDCNQITYNWSGNGLNANSNNAQVTHNANGAYTYTVIATKNGCSSIEKTVTVNVSGCGDNNPEQPVAYSACIEAENSGGNGSISDDPNASAGKTRGTPGTPSHYVDYQINNIPVSGQYRVTLRYSSESNSQVKATVNGSETMVSLAATHSWNIVFNEKSFNVTLNAGSNTLKIEGIGSHSTRQDKICVESTSQNGSARMIAEELEISHESNSLQLQELVLSPNPAVSYVNAEYYLNEGEIATLSINDMLGQIIHTQEVSGSGARQQETVRFSGQKPGLYLIRLRSDRQNQVKKLILIP